MAAIPSAKVFVQAQEQKAAAHAASKAEEHARAQEKWFTRLTKASDDFVRDMTKRLVAAITAASASASSKPTHYIELRINKLPVYQGLPGDVVLYGHRRDEGWYNRAPLELDVQPFEALQAAFYASEWFLVEESDSQRSFTIIFRLYAQLPRVRGHLWHGHNVFDEEKMTALMRAEEKSAKEPAEIGEDEEPAEAALDKSTTVDELAEIVGEDEDDE